MITIVNPLLESLVFTGDVHQGFTPASASFYISSGQTHHKSYILNRFFEGQEYLNEDPTIIETLNLYVFDAGVDTSAVTSIAGLLKVHDFYDLVPGSFYFSIQSRKLFILSALDSFVATSLTVTSILTTSGTEVSPYVPSSGGVLLSVNSGDLGCVAATVALDSQGSIQITSPVSLDESLSVNIDIQVSFLKQNAKRVVNAYWCEYESSVEIENIESIQFENRIYTYIQDFDSDIPMSPKFFVNVTLDRLLTLNY